MLKPATSLRITLILLWMISAAIYIRYEAYPAWFTRTIPGYRGIIPDNLLTRDSWARILIEEQPAGFIHTVFTMEDEGPDPLLEITTRLQIRAQILQSIQNIRILSEIHLDQDYQPRHFSLSASTANFQLRVTGKHTGNRTFEVTTVAGTRTLHHRFTLPAHTILFSPLQELALQQLRPGRSMVLRTLDPLTMQTTTILIRAEPYETLTIHGRSVRAMPLHMNWQGLELRSWIDADGMMLRQQTPFGWTLEAATAQEALQAVEDTHPAPPLLPGTTGLSLLQTLIGTPGTRNAQPKESP